MTIPTWEAWVLIILAVFGLCCVFSCAVLALIIRRG